MAGKAPGEHYRKGMKLTDLIRVFSDDRTAEKLLEESR